MAGSSFGSLFRVSTFGESHGPALGCVVDGCPPGLALDEALTQLEEQWPEKARLVKLRYFAGLTIPEAARAMKISTATAERHWKFARAWLHSQLNSGE